MDSANKVLLSCGLIDSPNAINNWDVVFNQFELKEGERLLGV